MSSNGSASDLFPDNIDDCHTMIAELRRQVRSAEENAEELESLWKRMSTDFENYRRRIEAEKLKAKSPDVVHSADETIVSPKRLKVLGYKPGQSVLCKVINSEPGGYAVVITEDDQPGFLPTKVTLHPGDEVPAQFVCVSNNRFLLSARFSPFLPNAQGSRQQETQVQEDGAPIVETDAVS